MSRRTFGLRHSDPMLRTPNDADTCRDFVVPALEQSGWTNAPNSVVEQYAYTDGKVAVGARGAVRGRRRIADYLLRVGPDTPLAVVEAKRAGKGMADVRALLFSRFDTLTADADRRPLGEIAPLTRRPVDVNVASTYDEIGIRSFGRGVFHKLPTTGADLGDKRVFWIADGDLLFNIVFAWEGAVAVAGPDDSGRIGSHRFLACVPDPALATSQFLQFFFLTDEGIARLGEASPGCAGRNKTLGLKALNAVRVPVPPLDVQREFDALQQQVSVLTDAAPAQDLDALLASAVARAFSAE